MLMLQLVCKHSQKHANLQFKIDGVNLIKNHLRLEVLPPAYSTQLGSTELTV